MKWRAFWFIASIVLGGIGAQLFQGHFQAFAGVICLIMSFEFFMMFAFNEYENEKTEKL